MGVESTARTSFYFYNTEADNGNFPNPGNRECPPLSVPSSHIDSAKESVQIPCMTQSTLTCKNQTTIPKAVVEALQLRPSDQLVYEIEKDGRVILTAKTGTFASVAASLPHRNNAASSRSIDEMKAAVKTMARKRMTRAEP